MFLILYVILFKIQQKMCFKKFTGEDQMADKVVIITGSNTDIGFATAMDLAKRGAKIILACKDEQKGEQSALKIIKVTRNPNIHLKKLDLASFQSVREFAKQIHDSEPILNILINYSGTGLLDNSLTKDNLPIEAQVNHFISAPSRIINVTSVLYKFGTIENLDKQASGYLERQKVYSNTKLANVLFTIRLHELLRDTGVTVNCLHPGAVINEIFRNQPRIFRFLLNFLFLTPEEGAQTIIFLAAAKELEGVSGGLFANCTELMPADKALDFRAASRLIMMSAYVTAGQKKRNF